MNKEALEKTVKILKLQQIAVLSLVSIKLLKELKKRKRRWWVKPHLMPHIRETVGAYAIVCEFFKVNDHEEFEKQFKMSANDFDKLNELVGNQIKKQHCVRVPIYASIRLAITLQYLGHGGTAVLNSLYYRVGRSTYYLIIVETCLAIASVLIPIYIPPPNEEIWLRIAKDFEQKWNFPNCIGALDGKHMRVKKPPHGGSVFFNYKKFHSLVLMAISDADCRFIWFTIGDGGSYSDSSVFNNTQFYEKLCNNQLQIPGPRQLPNSNKSSPFVLVADEIFGLQKNLMKPYNRRFLHKVEERIFNYRLSRARFTIECSFGILCSKWQLLTTALGFSVDNSKLIISACLSLHNFLLTNRIENVYNHMHHNLRQEEIQNDCNLISPISIRQNFTEYFANEGAVPWQNNYI